LPEEALSMRKIREILRLSAMGLAQHQIARSCSIVQSTVHKYLKLAEAAQLRWPLPEELSDHKLDQLLFGRRSAPPSRRIHPPVGRHNRIRRDTGGFGRVGRAGFGDDVVASPGASGTRGIFGRAEGCMKSANRHHGLHIGCSPAPTCGSVAFTSGRNLPHVSMVKTADARQRNQLRSGRLGTNGPAARGVLAQPIVNGVSLPNPS